LVFLNNKSFFLKKKELTNYFVYNAKIENNLLFSFKREIEEKQWPAKKRLHHFLVLFYIFVYISFIKHVLVFIVSKKNLNSNKMFFLDNVISLAIKLS
jgi:hypothetical protein